MKLGFLVNPIAGIGGKVGLKGSDGDAVFKEAISRGAAPESEQKALVSMMSLKDIEDKLEIFTCPGPMGEDVCRKAGLKYKVPEDFSIGESTSPDDTIKFAIEFVEMGVDLLLFAGGDGTARNILDAVGESCTVLGIPTGCKIHSGVYAINPKRAAVIVRELTDGRHMNFADMEVMDIDEDLFRKGIVDARLYGYLRVPGDESLMQGKKSSRPKTSDEQLESIAAYIADTMDCDTLYIIGTGSTTAAIMKELNIDNTLLGVDLVYNKKLLDRDLSERDILNYLDSYPKSKLIVSIIGGQGYLLGRGNQQLSADVIRSVGKDNIIVVSSMDKLIKLPDNCLYVDTGDDEINSEMAGYIRVITGYKQSVMIRVEC